MNGGDLFFLQEKTEMSTNPVSEMLSQAILDDTLKLVDFPVRYPIWAKCETFIAPKSPATVGTVKRSTLAPSAPRVPTVRPLALQSLCGLHIAAHSDTNALKK